MKYLLIFSFIVLSVYADQARLLSCLWSSGFKVEPNLPVVKLVGQKFQIIKNQDQPSIHTFDMTMDRYLSVPTGGRISTANLVEGKEVIDSSGLKWKVQEIDVNGDNNNILLQRSKTGEVFSLDVAPMKFPSFSYTFKFSGDHQINVVVPIHQGKEDLRVLESLKLQFSELPEQHIDAIDTVVFSPHLSREDVSWRSKYKDFERSYASGGDNKIYFFDSENVGKGDYELNSLNFKHEFSHNLVDKLFGQLDPPAWWKAAMELDGDHVSTYAKFSEAEDIAETIRVYLETDGGRLNQEIRKKFKYRFKALDQFLVSHPERKENLAADIFQAFIDSGGRPLAAFSTLTGAAYITMDAPELMNYVRDELNTK